MADEQLKISELPIVSEADDTLYMLAEHKGEFKRVNAQDELINTFIATYGSTVASILDTEYSQGKIIEVRKIVENGLAPGFYDEDDNLVVDWATVESKGYNIEEDESGVVLDSILLEYDAESAAIVKKVVIPRTVTRIGSYAFHYEANWTCSGITSIILPDTVIEIADYAFLPLFSSEASLRRIAVPYSVTSIGTEAFGDDATAQIYYGTSADRDEFGNLPELFGKCSCNTFDVYEMAPDEIKYQGYSTTLTHLSKVTTDEYRFTRLDLDSQSIIQHILNRDTSEWSTSSASIAINTNVVLVDNSGTALSE